MSNPVPSSIALTNVSGQIASAPVNNDWSAIQTAVNGLITDMSGGAAAQVLQAVDSSHVQWAYPPGYEFDYKAFTVPVAVTATVEATPTTIVTADAVTFDGVSTAIIHFFAPSVTCPSAAAGRVIISVWEGATQLGRICDVGTDAAGNALAGCKGEFRLTPSAGSHTYSIAAYRITANMNVNAGVGGTGAYAPGFVRIVKA